MKTAIVIFWASLCLLGTAAFQWCQISTNSEMLARLDAIEHKEKAEQLFVKRNGGTTECQAKYEGLYYTVIVKDNGETILLKIETSQRAHPTNCLQIKWDKIGIEHSRTAPLEFFSSPLTNRMITWTNFDGKYIYDENKRATGMIVEYKP